MDDTVRLALVGLGKIAHDHHLPAIEATTGITLVAVASRNAHLDGVASFRTIDELLASGVEVDAVSLCTPASVRRPQAERALDAGKHVMLEKPPVASLTEMAPLLGRARRAGRTLFATWHSRFGVAVEPARALLADVEIRSVAIEWKEDVRFWHPGQEWIWEPGGLGVFDPGINALSVATRILPRPFFLRAAELYVPAGRQMPIAARLAFEDEAGVPIAADLDWRHPEPRVWSIHVETGVGRISLTEGGARLERDGAVLASEESVNRTGLSPSEYPGLYRHFIDLIARAETDADLLPLQHAADAFMIGRRHAVEPFSGT